MSTTWHTKFRKRGDHLTTAGEVISEPVIEESSTGMKVRIAGRSNSFYKKQQDQMVLDGTRRIAERAGAQLWMPLDVNERTLESRAGVDDDVRLVFDLNAGNIRGVAWWKFRHPSMPVSAIITSRWTTTGEFGHAVRSHITVPNQRPSLDPGAYAVTEFNSLTSTAPEDFRSKFEEMVDSGEQEWLQRLGNHLNLSERSAAEVFLRTVREIEALETIDIPDQRFQDRGEFGWLTLGAHSTNVTGRFVGDLIDYLDGSGMDEVRAAYSSLVEALRRNGMVLPNNLDDSQLFRAMNGEKEPLTIRFAGAVNETGNGDSRHDVSVHLPTGTFVVTCHNSAKDRNEVADRYEEAMTLATLTGRKDDLLAYGQALLSTTHDERTEKTMSRRLSATN